MWWLAAKKPQRVVQWPKAASPTHNGKSRLLQKKCCPSTGHPTALAHASHWTLGTTPPSSQPRSPIRTLHWPRGTSMHHHTWHRMLSSKSHLFSSLSNIPMPTCSKPITWSLIVYIWSSLTASIWLPSELICTVTVVSRTLASRQMNSTQPSQGRRQDLLPRTWTHAIWRHCVCSTGRSSPER